MEAVRHRVAIVGAALALAVTGAAAGCGNDDNDVSGEEAEQAAEQAGQAAEEAGQAAGEAGEDAGQAVDEADQDVGGEK
jgi:hypothetical protein